MSATLTKVQWLAAYGKTMLMMYELTGDKSRLEQARQCYIKAKKTQEKEESETKIVDIAGWSKVEV
jgi:hypothetical protein